MSMPTPARVLVFTDLWPTERHPGLARWIVEPVQLMRARGVDVRVVVLRRAFPPSRLVSELASPRELRSAWFDWRGDQRSPLFLPTVATAVRYTSPPRPLAHETWGSWAWMLRRSRLLQLAEEAAPDIVVGHFAIPAGDIAVRVGRYLGVPSAVHVHGLDLDFTAARSARGRDRVASVLARADLVVSNSESTAAKAMHLATPRRLATLWQGGDVTVSEDAISLGTELRVLSVGGLGSDKGWDDSVEILRLLRARHPAIRWTIAGSGTGSQSHDLIEAAGRAGLGDVLDYRGEVPPSVVSALMADSDVFLLPSQKDAYGVVFAEALGSGLLVVGGAEAGAIADFAAAGAPVIAIRRGEAAQAAEHLAAMLQDPGWLHRVRAQSVRWASEHLGWGRYVDGLMAEYSGILETSRSCAAAVR